MKRIIYRVWDKGNKRMLYSESFHANFYTEPNLGKCVCGVAHSIPRSEPMLFTGLEDRNDKWIFEGDIVSFKYSNCKLKAQVVYDNIFCSFRLIQLDNDEQKYEIRDGRCYEVIGNIHKNPDLLTFSEKEKGI